MRFLIFSCLLAIAQCGYPVAPQNSYPTPPPSDSYVIPKASYPTAPGSYPTKPHNRESGPVPPPPPPPNPAHYQDNEVQASVSNVQSAPPAPLSDSSFSSLASLPAAPAAPTYGGSVSSGSIAGGSALNYNTAAPACKCQGFRTIKNPEVSDRKRAKARARARARTVQNRRFHRRQLQPIRRFHRFHKKARQ